jgi:hypothetical protein
MAALLYRCYQWQVGNPEQGSWAVSLREEQDKIWLGYIWENRQEGDAR